MKTKDLFALNWKTFIIDLIIFIIGFFLSGFFITLCKAELGEPCPQPVLAYVGLILILISVIHFLINLIILIVKKVKK